MKDTFRGAALALALTSLTSIPALAETEADRRATFENARDAMQAKRWAEAHQIFMGLWEKQRTYDVALHLGQVEYHLQQYREAAAHLDYGLMLLPPREKPEIAERSRALLALCKQEIGTLELRVKHKGAQLLVDGVVVAEAPLFTDTYVAPGKHQFEVRLEGYVSENWEAEFGPGDSKQRIVLLKANSAPLSAPTGAASGLSPATTAPTMDVTARQTSWTPVLVGSGLSLIGIGTGVGLALVRGGLTKDAKALRDKVGSSSSDGCVNPRENKVDLCAELQNKNSNYDTYGTLETVGFAFGGAALIATATYFFISRPDRVKSVSAMTTPPFRLDGNFGKSFAQLQLSADF
jgi:hypothetical protein